MSRVYWSLVCVLFLVGCEGAQGPVGTPGAKGEPGKAAENCTLADNGDGTGTVTCPDGTTVTVPTGTGTTDGGVPACTVTDNGDGTATVKCPGGEVTVPTTEPDPELVGDPTALTVEISKVEIASPPVVTFKVTNQDGKAFPLLAQKLLTDRRMRFTIAKLVPAAAGSGDSDNWQSYINVEEDTSASKAGPDGTPKLAKAIHAAYENKGTLKYMGGGMYTYTFDADVKAITTPVAVSYDADVLHRVAIQLEYPLMTGEEIIVNPFFDWVPSGKAAPATRKIALTSSCNECHTNLAIHGGGRTDVEYCVVCHNPGSTDANSGNTVDMKVMIHKIHNGHNLSEPYIIWGYRDGKHDYSHVGYPQDINNCRKCHNADDTDTPQGDNWKMKPTMAACGSCHDGVNFATGAGHSDSNLVQADNKNCANCHTPEKIEEVHLTENATPNNPNLPAGIPDIKYELTAATVAANTQDLTVKFKLTRDGTALDLANLPANMKDPDRYPAVMLMFAVPQDGIDEPADWNNVGNGNAGGQPDRIDLDQLSATFNAADGVHTATITDAFPAGAKLRAVAIQGYFYWRTDLADTSGDSDVARHAISAYTTVDGDKVRREVVDSNKCANCHEWFEGHGGNRVWDYRVCAGCHVPNLSSSGRMLDLAHPEANNGLKDMIHGIHGAAKRTTPLDFVRNRQGGIRYTFISHDKLADYPTGHVVAYPQSGPNCLACHTAGTLLLDGIPKNALASTAVTGDMGESTSAEYTAKRSTLPNNGDIVTSPQTAACSSCHNSAPAIAHYTLNGGTFEQPRDEYVAVGATETCVLCHGQGRTAAVDKVHGL